jgi:hypothetical protein
MVGVPATGVVRLSIVTPVTPSAPRAGGALSIRKESRTPLELSEWEDFRMQNPMMDLRRSLMSEDPGGAGAQW